LAAFLPQEIIPAVENAGLPSSSVPDLLTALGNGTTAALQTVPGVNQRVLDALSLANKSAYSRAFKIVYLATLAFTGVGMIAAFFIVDIDDLLTGYVNKTVHRPKSEKDNKRGEV
jgi:hypothetical protein